MSGLRDIERATVNILRAVRWASFAIIAIEAGLCLWLACEIFMDWGSR